MRLFAALAFVGIAVQQVIKAMLARNDGDDE